MRIISANKDYYDCMQHYSEDKKTIFIRKQYSEIIEYTKIFDKDTLDIMFWNDVQYLSYDKKMNYSVYILNMCGDIKVGIYTCIDKPNTYWDMKEYKQFREEVEACLNKRRASTLPSHKSMLNFCKKVENNYCDKIKKLTEKEPISVISGTSGNKLYINYNYSLETLSMNKLYSRIEVYQRVQSWIYNKAAPEKSIPFVSDEDMLCAKGFDLKKSFRKPKRD